MGHHLMGVMQTLASDATSFNTILRARYGMEHTLPENYRRFADKFNTFLKEGYPSLISKHHGNVRALKVEDTVAALLNSIFTTNHKPTPAEIKRTYDGFKSGYVEVINNVTGEDYQPVEFPSKLSESAIRQFLSDWDSRIGTDLIRTGDRQRLMGKNKPYHSMDLPKFAGSLLSIDDRQPPFKYTNTDRVWFYLGQDAASLAITTWVYGKSKEGIMLEFYRQMVRNYHEWGINLPFELEAESNLNASFTSTFLQEGRMFENVKIEANNARGKLIESRFNRAVRYDPNLEKGEAGWIARPMARGESNQEGTAKVPVLPYADIVNMSLGHIVTWNNMPHHEDKSISRWDYFMRNQHPDLKPTNYKSFLKWLGYKTETSCNAGIIRLNRAEYLLGNNGQVATGDTLIGYMREAEGQNIDVYWLDDNYGGIICALVYIGDKLICEAVKKPVYQRAKLEQTPADLEARSIMSAYVATIEAYSRQQRKAIDKVTVIDHRQVTVSNSFQIPGLKQPAAHADEHSARAEMLPDPENEFGIEDLNAVERPVKSSMYDRF
jgi:hypothetical protein